MSGDSGRLARFVANGLVATAVHFGVLSANLHLLGMSSAGLANFLASAAGITTSFLGSRYFVFRKADEPMLAQAMRFSGLYGAIAVLHGLILLVWTDHWGLDYRIGFLIATAVQVSLSYAGNKVLVFRT